MNKLIPALVLLSILGCKEDDPQLVEMGLNGDFESGSNYPTYWYSSYPTTYTMSWTDVESFSGGKSVTISKTVAESQNFAFWAQQNCNGVPTGRKLVLRVKIKSNLVGTGVSIALRADDSPTATSGLAFATTQGSVPITGSRDWEEFSVEMPMVPDKAKCLYVFLVYLPDTTGEVYFDDVSLVYQ